MDLADIPPGLLIWKVISWLWIGLWVTMGLLVHFSKKAKETEKRAFWLYVAYAPLGVLYDLIIGMLNFRKRNQGK